MDLRGLTENHKEVALQWAPTYCSLQGNETADSQPKKATRFAQLSDKPIPFYTAKRLIKKNFKGIFSKNMKEAKTRKELKKSQTSHFGQGAELLPFFCLATGHD